MKRLVTVVNDLSTQIITENKPTAVGALVDFTATNQAYLICEGSISSYSWCISVWKSLQVEE